MSTGADNLEAKQVSEPPMQVLRDEHPLLRPFKDSELVIGLVAPLGADLSTVREVLEKCLSGFGYHVETIRITQDVIPVVQPPASTNEAEYEARTTALMDAGNEARKQSRDNGILALGAASVILGLREKAKEFAGGELKDKQRRRAYIVSSLKHPAEVETMRLIYPDGFYLIGVHENPDDRLRHLIEDKDVAMSKAQALIERDAEEKHQEKYVKHGQRVTDTFHLSDFFIRLHGNPQQMRVRLEAQLTRVVQLLFGNPFLTPTFDEYAMFMAFAASLRSADLSRQVGAVVAQHEQVIATGANDCPRFGGGLYWPASNRETGVCEDAPLGRDFTRGVDSNVKVRGEIIKDIVEAVKTALKDKDNFLKGMTEELKKGSLSKQPDEEKRDHLADAVANEVQQFITSTAQLEAYRKVVASSRLKELTEYGRVVHAEMEALLSCGRVGISPADGTVYTTTFPCHNCAKHIIAAGVRRVVFIEPYQKSKAFEFHNEAMHIGFQAEGPPLPKVQFEPFVGVGPRRFFDLFSISLGSGEPLTRKEEDGTGLVKPFSEKSATLRLQMLPHPYVETEEDAAFAFKKAANPNGVSEHARES